MRHPCRVFTRPDGTVIVHIPSPFGRADNESEGEWLARAYGRLIETQPDLADLPFLDTYTDRLPPREIACETCGDAHSVRDQWRAEATGVPVHDGTARNILADAHHLERAEVAELGKVVPDPARLTAIDFERRRLRLFAEGKIPEPPAEAVRVLVVDVATPTAQRSSR